MTLIIAMYMMYGAENRRMIIIDEVLKQAAEKHASDVFIVAGRQLSIKVNGNIEPYSDEILTPNVTEKIIKDIYVKNFNLDIANLERRGEADFSFSIRDVGRFRVNVYRQRNSYAAVLRIVAFGLPDPVKLGIPETVINLSKKTRGLALVTGPAGSGKSTTLACIIDKINCTRKCHIMTLEDPIEYLHPHKMGIVSQREVPTDTESYLYGLKASLRQAPDVILIGEMRDLETINIALTAAETGHFVLSTLHTMGAANTIDRIIDVFPPAQQQQIRIQLSMVLQAVVSQQIMPTVDKGQVAAFEIMMNTPAVSNMIREAKLHQISSVIHTSGESGMQTIDSDIVALCKKGLITKETALTYATSRDIVARQIGV